MNEMRFATKQDLKEIEKVFKQVRDEVSEPALFNWSDEHIEQELVRSDFFLSVDAHGSVQAFIAHRVNGDFVEIMALGTDPRLKQKGVMLTLLNVFVQKFGNQGLSITLEVHELNLAAVSLYRKNGFKQVRLRPSYYKDGKAALVMTYSS